MRNIIATTLALLTLTALGCAGAADAAVDTDAAPYEGPIGYPHPKLFTPPESFQFDACDVPEDCESFCCVPLNEREPDSGNVCVHPYGSCT